MNIDYDSRPVKKRIGLIVLATDHTCEQDFSRIFNADEVAIYTNRIAFENPTSLENLQKTGPLLTKAAADILPMSDLDALIYACTSASIVLGNDTVRQHLQKAKPDAKIITPSSAAFAALKDLKLRGIKADKIAILAPYSKVVSDELTTYFTHELAKQNQEISHSLALGLDNDEKMAHIKKDCLIELACHFMQNKENQNSDALFISCTALRSFQVIEEIERRINRPVLSSNQVMIWQLQRLLALTPISGYGRLFS